MFLPIFIVLTFNSLKVNSLKFGKLREALKICTDLNRCKITAPLTTYAEQLNVSSLTGVVQIYEEELQAMLQQYS